MRQAGAMSAQARAVKSFFKVLASGLGGEVREPAAGRAGVPLSPPALMKLAVGEGLCLRVWVTAHAVEGERLDLEGVDGVGVASLTS